MRHAFYNSASNSTRDRDFIKNQIRNVRHTRMGGNSHNMRFGMKEETGGVYSPSDYDEAIESRQYEHAWFGTGKKILEELIRRRQLR